MRFKVNLVIMLIVSVVAAWSFFSNSFFTGKNVRDIMAHDLSLAIDLADNLVSIKVNLLKSNASTVAERLLKAGSNEEMAVIMASQIGEFPEFMALTVFDDEGPIVSHGTPITPAEILEESHYVKIAQSGESVISTTLYDNDTNDFIMYVFAPLGHDKILSATINGLTFSRLVADYRLWQTGNIFMIDTEGTVIASSREELVLQRHNYLKETAASRKKNPNIQVISDFIRKALLEEKGTGIYDIGGADYLCSYKRLAGSASWHIGVAVPLRESPEFRVHNDLLFSSLLLLIVGFLISIFASGYVARPFHKIEEQNRNLEELNDTVRAQAAQIRKEHGRIKLLLDSMPLTCRLW
ncbi:MAG: hypothetical protein FWG09_06010, partial [Synergistaceae bacterium]|nr:hypothetical protein [Synergistaceae bacterium]